MIMTLFVLLSCTLRTDTIKDNLTQTKGEMLENVHYIKNTKQINSCKKPEEVFYVPRENILTFFHKPQCFHTPYGHLCLYDLSMHQKFLNALKYDYIEIEGDIQGIELGISDMRYYKRQDHVSLPSSNRIDLSMLFNKVDLSRLKYIITLSEDQNETHLKITFSQKHNRNKTEKRLFGVWIWNPQKASVKKIEAYRFNVLYIQMKKGFLSLVKYFSDASMTIYGLNGSPENIWHYQDLLSDIERLGELKKKYHNIRGYQIDVEPYLLKEFDVKEEKIWESYMEMLVILAKKAHEQDLIFSVVIPYWFESVYIQNGKNLAHEVFNVADEIVLMSYKSDLTQAHYVSEPIIAYGKFLGKKTYIGLELTKIKDKKYIRDTEHILDCSNDNQKVLSSIPMKQTTFDKMRDPDISFYGQTDKLRHLKKYDFNIRGFGGYVLHYLDILPDENFFEE